MYFDTHAHFDDSRYDQNREELLARSRENGVDFIVNIGAGMGSSKGSVELAQKHDFIYAAVGVHPHEAESMTDADIETLTDMTKHEKVMAIGEIGLDYHYDNSPRDIQKRRFIDQMELARALKLPVVIHDREAHGDCLEIVKQFKDVRGVYHCYAGSVEQAKILLNMGYMLSFNGIITFKNAKTPAEVVKYVPIESLMLETDCPYLSPEPLRGQLNHSGNLEYICARMAQIKNMEPEQVAQITMKNGIEFFGIG